MTDNAQIQKENKRASHYPIFLDLSDRLCLVVGGGQVAFRKVKSLLECGAKVKVVSPDISHELEALAKSGDIEIVRKQYQSGDISGAFLVIGATDDNEVNRRISHDAEEKSIPVNIVDVPELCSFIVPSVIHRGPVSIAISTGGASPLLARRLRELLENHIKPEFGKLAELLGNLREEVKQSLPSEEERRKAWQRILDSDVLDLLEQGKDKEAEKKARECIFQ